MSANHALPAGCRWVSLADLVVDGPTNGYSGPTGSDATGSPTLRLSATSSGTFILNESTTKRLYETIPPDSDLWLEPGDLLVQRSNTIDLVGTAAIYEGRSRAFVYPDLMMRLRMREPDTARFAWRYMNSPAGRAFFLSMAAGSSGSMPKISGAKLRTMQVPVPPLAEQRRIAEVLDRAEALRAKRRAAIAQLDTLTQALFFDTFGDPLTNRNGLETAELSTVCTRVTDGTHQSPTWSPTGHPFLFISNIASGEIEFDTQKFISDETHAELTRRCPIEIGDVLYSTVGSYGIPALVRTSRKFAFQRHIAHLKPNQKVLNSEFLCAMLGSLPLRQQADRAARGMAQKTVNLADIKNFIIFRPPLALQQDFARRIAAVEKLKAAHRASLAELDALFASLQHRAFRGEL